MNKSVNHSLKHLKHPIFVDGNSIATKFPGLIHPGKILCKQCNKHIKWASYRDLEIYERYKNKIVTYEDLQKYIIATSESPGEGNAIYLAISYKEKHIAKNNGAKFDALERLWYTYPSNPKAINLIDYMMPDDVRWLKNYRYIHQIE